MIGAAATARSPRDGRADAATDGIRIIDISEPAAVETLATVLAEDAAPAIVRVASPELAQRVLPALRPHDDLVDREETAAMLAVRIRRVAGRRDEALELAQRRQHVDPLTGLPDRLCCVQWLEVDDNAWPMGVQRGLLSMDIDWFKSTSTTSVTSTRSTAIPPAMRCCALSRRSRCATCAARTGSRAMAARSSAS